MMLPAVRPLKLRIPVLLLSGLMLVVGCGGAPGTAAVTGSATAAAGSTVDDTNNVGAAGGTNTPAEQKTAKLDMSVRVVNLYIPGDKREGAAVDVWVGSPNFGGKKLITVAYGKVSEYIAPEIPDPLGQGPDGPHADYSLNVYAAGSSDHELMNQGEKSSPGHSTSLMPSTPAGARIQYLESDGKLHSAADHSTDLIGGTSALPDVMDPATQFRGSHPGEQQMLADACAATPVFGPVDPNLTSGDRAYGFQWGSDTKSIHPLVVPSG